MEQKNSFKEFIVTPLGRKVLICACALVIWGLIALIASIGNALVLIPAIPCAYFGWNALNRITPNVFLWMSWVGWLFYFFIKGFLAIAIGMFITPFVLGKKLAAKIQASL